MEKSQEWK